MGRATNYRATNSNNNSNKTIAKLSEIDFESDYDWQRHLVFLNFPRKLGRFEDKMVILIARTYRWNI